MPELAEVEFYRRVWNPLIQSGPLSVTVLARSRVFRGLDTSRLTASLSHGIIFSEARAKQMCFTLGDGSRVGIHLGMAGKLHCHPPSTKPQSHEQIRLTTAAGTVFTYRDTRYFGRVQHAPPGSTAPWWDNLAADLLSPEFEYNALRSFLSRRHRSPIKSILLMQERFPGIGNWMADEILWRARIPPDSPAGDLDPDQCKRLLRSIRFVCRGALAWIADRGEDPPSRSWLFRHRWKDGGTCPRCHTALIRIPINNRTSCYCPICQARPEASRKPKLASQNS